MMKSMWWKLFILCSICTFAGCSDDGEAGEEPEVCPFRNAVLQQTTARAGDAVTIGGEGFAAGVNVYLRNAALKIQVDAPEVAADGGRIDFVVPDVDGDTYKVIVEQEGEWPLSELLTVEKEDVVVTSGRKLLGYSYDNGMEGKRNVHYEFRFTWQGDSLVKVQKRDAGEGGGWLDYFAFDYLTADSIRVRANMAVVDSSKHVTGWQDYFTLVLDGQRVKYCINSGVSDTWFYSGKGYPQVVYNSPRSENGYTFSPSGNLTSWDMGNRGIMPNNFVYDKEEYTNPMGMDFGAFYGMILNSAVNDPEFYAHVMRVAGRSSALLPSGVKGKKEMSEATIFDFTYVRDDEGFVTEAASLQYTYYIDPDTQQYVGLYVTKRFIFSWGSAW